MFVLPRASRHLRWRLVEVERRRIHNMVSSMCLLLFSFLSEFFRSRHDLDFSSLSVVRDCLAALLEETHSSTLVLRYERHLL